MSLSCGPVPRFPEQRGQHAADQSDKEADRRIWIFIQEKGKNICDPEKADNSADKNRDQFRYMSLEIFKGLDKSSMIGL